MTLRGYPALLARYGTEGITRSAVISECGAYRYRLDRTWDVDRYPTCFICLNPSTADAVIDDPTIRRCMGFAFDWGAGGIVVVNLFATRATDPKELVLKFVKGADVRGPDRDTHLREVFTACDTVVCAWGAHYIVDIAKEDVLALVPPETDCVCLGVTRGGKPKHPLYLAQDTERVPFSTRST